jgi:hypothetical protein
MIIKQEKIKTIMLKNTIFCVVFSCHNFLENLLVNINNLQSEIDIIDLSYCFS